MLPWPVFWIWFFDRQHFIQHFLVVGALLQERPLAGLSIRDSKLECQTYYYSTTIDVSGWN